MTTPDTSVVRAWARDNGFDVAGRGRLPAEVVDAYTASRKQAAPTKSSAAEEPAVTPGPAKRGAKAPGEAPAKKAPAKKAPVTKAPAKKAPATKAPAKKAPAKKAPAKMAPATTAPAQARRKAPATKAPATTAPATTAPATKATTAPAPWTAAAQVDTPAPVDSLAPVDTPVPTDPTEVFADASLDAITADPPAPQAAAAPDDEELQRLVEQVRELSERVAALEARADAQPERPLKSRFRRQR